MATDSTSTPSYIDYPTILSPTFSPTAYANSLIYATNNPTDTPLDLSTPLSRLLFDVQEVDTHIDTLTTTHALPILEDARTKRDAGSRVLESVEQQVEGLRESYARLEREVLGRWEEAEQVRLVAERLVKTLRLGRSVQRVVALGRQVEGQMEELGREGAKVGEWRVMVPMARTVLQLRAAFGASGLGEEGEGLGRVQVVQTLRQEVVAPAERTLLAKAQGVVREFGMSSLLSSSQAQQGQTQGQNNTTSPPQTFAQTEDTKSRATSALQILYLLSPTKPSSTSENFDPTLLISALQTYLNTALTSSLAALTRALATLPTLDRTLLEISARCQNIVALEALLSSIPPPAHPNLQPTATPTPSTLLDPLIRHLDTPSLPSYFWRSLASQLSSRVQEILSRGGVSARTLRTNRDKVRDAIRECVDVGSRLPVSSAALGKGRVEGGGNWEREAAVMVGSVIGPLGR